MVREACDYRNVFRNVKNHPMGFDGKDSAIGRFRCLSIFVVAEKWVWVRARKTYSTAAVFRTNTQPNARRSSVWRTVRPIDSFPAVAVLCFFFFFEHHRCTRMTSCDQNKCLK